VRRADVFFYGLFMDEALLRAKGLDPQGRAPAALDDYALRIGQRATVVPAPGSHVHGVVYSLTPAELADLYDDPSVQAYHPIAVLAQLGDGSRVAALCYVLATAPAPSERNPDYAARLYALATRLGLPRDYVATIQ
jgi:hypothetical protein